MKHLFPFLVFICFISSCNYSKSVNKDTITGLLTKGDVLSCDDVYLSKNEIRTSVNTFIYGEKITINFNNISGFAIENGKVFPAMEILITDNEGDTVMQTSNLYANRKEGFEYSPLKLTADLLLASPIQSGYNYDLLVNIHDTKGSGTFKSKLNFTVERNKLIDIGSTGVKYDEIYLFSQESSVVIPDNKAKLKDNIYIIVEGLTGFKPEKEMIYPGMSLKITDSSGNLLVDRDDLFKEYEQTGIDDIDFISRLSTHFNISEMKFSNPVNCTVTVWDKKSDAKIKIATTISFE